MSLSTKLTFAISVILAMVLSCGAGLIWKKMDEWAWERFRDELATITGYAHGVREFLAETRWATARSAPAPDTLAIPVIAAWTTARRYAESKGYWFKTPALQPRNPANAPDAFEREALSAFQEDPQQQTFYRREELPDGEEVLRYAVPVRISADCLPCHGQPAGEPDDFGYPREGCEVGDLRGAFVVSAPILSYEQVRLNMRRTFVLVGLWTIVGVALAVYFAVRRVTRPLGELTRVAQRLGGGQLDQRIQFQANDEVGHLAATFNRMAASLQTYQDTLEQKVEERTRELEHSQRQLLQAAKLASVGELASGIAHELNNPAGIILMRTARLAQEIEQCQLSEEASEDVEAIQRQVKKISRIVSGLLTFSRRSNAELKPMSLNDLLRRTVALIEDLIRNRKVEVVLDLSDGLPRVEADSAQIEQVLLNLINNALDAMPKGGKLTFSSRLVESREHGKAVAIGVADSGCGIPGEELSRIFDPFFTTKEAGQGTGLGLSISYGIIEEHGGSIEVESRPDQGTCFTIYLPVVEGKPLQALGREGS